MYAAFEDEDLNENTNAYHQNKLRKYEVNKMRYYYAIIHCDSGATACHLYDEFNGIEFENSNIQLNLSLVPDEVKFEQAARD